MFSPLKASCCRVDIENRCSFIFKTPAQSMCRATVAKTSETEACEITELACCIPVSLCRDLTSRIEEDIVDQFKTADPTTTLLIFAIQGLSACCCSFKDPLSTLSAVLLFAQGFTCTTLFKTALSTLSISSRPHSQRCRCFGAWTAHSGLFAQNLSHACMRVPQ